MSISVRVGIAYDGAHHHEHFNVSVLNGRSYYIDIRTPHSALPTLSLEDIHWAFAGTRIVTPTTVIGTTQSVWTHTIDSRCLVGQVPDDDIGEMIEDPNDASITYERGPMTDPATGIRAPGEEIWKDTIPPAGTMITFLERTDKLALVGIIGTISAAVGRSIEDGQFFLWRRKAGTLIHTFGREEGVDFVHELENGKEWNVGEVKMLKGQEWIVRECYRV